MEAFFFGHLRTVVDYFTFPQHIVAGDHANILTNGRRFLLAIQHGLIRSLVRICRKVAAMSRFTRFSIVFATVSCFVFGERAVVAGELTVDDVQEIRNVNLTAEGSLDWMHFGRVDAGSVNRKSGVPAALGYSVLSANPQRFGSNGAVRSTLNWTDGAPTAVEPGFSGGLYFPAQNSGYVIVAPADTQPRTLTIHTGGWNSAGTLNISLSDSSASPVAIDLAGASVYHHTLTVVYSADSAGQSINVTHSMTSSGGNIALQAATLAGAAPNSPPTLANPGNRTVTVGESLEFIVSATDPDGPEPLVLDIRTASPALPAAASLTDNSDGTGTFAWTPLAEHVGVWSVTFRATDDGGDGGSDEETISITVNPASSGSLDATVPLTPPFTNSLTDEGTLDWMHFGRTTASSVIRKAGVSPLLTYAQLNANPSRFDHNATVRPTHTWTDGTPQAAEAGYAGGIFFSALNAGFSVTAPADTQTRTLKIHLGGWNSSSQVTVALSDGSASPLTIDIAGANVYHHLLTVNYSAASAGQTLTVTHTRTGGVGNIALQSVTLAGAPANQPPVIADPGNKSVVVSNPLSFDVVASDDDGPAPLLLDISDSSPALPAGATFTDGGNGVGSFSWIPTNQETGNYQVTFRAREDNGAGQSGTRTITIAVGANAAPELGAIGNRSTIVGNNLSFGVSATDVDGPLPLVLDISNSQPALPAEAGFTDDGGGFATFSWTPTPADIGDYQVTFRVREAGSSGQSDTETITITVSAGANDGSLSVLAPSVVPFVNDLTAEGTADWMQFGLTNATSVNRKAGVPAQLGYALLSGTAARFGDGPAFRPTHNWTDGVPTASEPGFSGGFYFGGSGASFRITAPADTTQRTLKVNLGGWNSVATLHVALSDDSTAAFSTSISGSSVYHHEVTVTYHAASAGQTVSLTLTATTGTGNIVLQAATLAVSGGGGNQAPQLTYPGDQTVSALNPLSFSVTAVDPDGPEPLVLDISGSSPPLPQGATFTDSGGGSGTFQWTPQSGDVGVYQVTFRAREDDGNGQSDTATILVTVDPNSAPVLTNPGNRSVTVGNPLSFNVSAIDPDGPAPLALDISASNPALPGGAAFTENGDGSGTFNWTPVAGQEGNYSITFRARESNGAGQSDEESISITVNAPQSGDLNVSAVAVSPYTNNLSSEGTLDWMHFGLASEASINRKASVSPLLTYSPLTGTPARFGNGPAFRPTHVWGDGAPTSTEAGFSGGIYFAGNGASFRITAPADTSERTLKVHLGGWNSTASLQVAISDGSAAPFSTTLGGASVYHNEVIVTYRAATAGETVALTLTATTGTGNIALQSASLGSPLALPITDDFDDGNLDGWSVVDESINLGDWDVSAGIAVQAAMVEDASARIGTYQLGSYLVLGGGASLTDYRFTVEAAHVDGLDTLAEDIGVMFRYQDANNYYRLSLNSRHGYTRLEKRVAGTFTTLAVNSRGYAEADDLVFTIEVVGPKLLVWLTSSGNVAGLSPEPLFAVTDSSLGNGTVALYAKEQARFDNVSITVPATAPSITLGSPIGHSTTSGDSLATEAIVRNVPEDGSVQFLLDGGSAIVDSTEPYSASFDAVAAGSHVVRANLLNSGGSVVVAYDENSEVGVLGEEIVAIGDSITNGIGDAFRDDNISTSGRVVGYQGFAAGLTDHLDGSRPFTPTVVFNEGMGGDDSFDAAFTRVDSILERYPGMDRVLLQFGTNDAFSIPSGLGCSGAACEDTFLGYMQVLIDKLRWRDYPVNTVASGIEINIALTPPNFLGANPYNSQSNQRIREYNQVIQNALTGFDETAMPDFYSYFMPGEDPSTHRDYLFADPLHPNGLAYEVISTIWHNELNPGSPLPLPFVVESVESSVQTNTPQVDLVGVGDRYRLDGDEQVVSLPAILEEGRWILTNDDAADASGDYLTFHLDRSATVYIAFDAGATSLPGWMGAWTPVVATAIATNDPEAPVLNLYSRTFAADSDVVLGGNSASGSSGATANYVVLVVED